VTSERRAAGEIDHREIHLRNADIGERYRQR
jgi:hypothetical protein